MAYLNWMKTNGSPGVHVSPPWSRRPEYDIRRLTQLSCSLNDCQGLFLGKFLAMIQFQHVFKEYRRSAMPVVALRDLCVDIPQGEFCALMGAERQRKKYALCI